MFNYNPGVSPLPSLEGVEAPLEEGEKSTGLLGNMKEEGVVPPAENK